MRVAVGIDDKASAVREFKVLLWRQDTQNNSTVTESQILVQIVESKENICLKSIRKRKTVVILEFHIGFFLEFRGV